MGPAYIALKTAKRSNNAFGKSGISPDQVIECPLTWVVPHTFRKTVATLIDEEANTKSAAAQLGHGSEEITTTYYIAKPAITPDNSAILERLGADRTTAESPAQKRNRRVE